MKTSSFQNWFVAASVAAFLTGNVLAQDATVPGNPTISAAPQLSAGVPQVLQLSQAKVGDGTIVNYIQNSGTIYALDANQIIYLKQQGVSDTVVNAMINQRSRLTGSTEPATSTAMTATATQMPTAYVPPAAYVETVPSTTVYVIPDTQTYRYDRWYSAYPYGVRYGNGFYEPYPYPAVSLSIGFGGRWGGGWGGGYHGGWHH